jgi:hypothetical protein
MPSKTEAFAELEGRQGTAQLAFGEAQQRYAEVTSLAQNLLPSLGDEYHTKLAKWLSVARGRSEALQHRYNQLEAKAQDRPAGRSETVELWLNLASDYDQLIVDCQAECGQLDQLSAWIGNCNEGLEAVQDTYLRLTKLALVLRERIAWHEAIGIDPSHATAQLTTAEADLREAKRYSQDQPGEALESLDRADTMLTSLVQTLDTETDRRSHVISRTAQLRVITDDLEQRLGMITQASSRYPEELSKMVASPDSYQTLADIQREMAELAQHHERQDWSACEATLGRIESLARDLRGHCHLLEQQGLERVWQLVDLEESLTRETANHIQEVIRLGERLEVISNRTSHPECPTAQRAIQTLRRRIDAVQRHLTSRTLTLAQEVLGSISKQSKALAIRIERIERHTDTQEQETVRFRAQVRRRILATLSQAQDACTQAARRRDTALAQRLTPVLEALTALRVEEPQPDPATQVARLADIERELRNALQVNGEHTVLPAELQAILIPTQSLVTIGAEAALTSPPLAIAATPEPSAVPA